ncbi:MAG: mandelate racemase/muconate lactonizing enzyme family protein [Gaiellales bacterium]
MRITAIRAYRQWQPFADGEYATAGGTAAGFDSVIVAMDTDDGATGWGEAAPLGAFYSEAFPAGARAGIAELAPHLIGEDPAQPRRLVGRMDAVMRGQAYVKSALDMAAWDAACRHRGQPLCEALGGRFADSVALYQVVPPLAPQVAAERARGYVAGGYRRLQIKVGGDPYADAERLTAVRDAVGADVPLYADANGAWTPEQARRFLHATAALDYTLEQPCGSHEECRAVRAACPHPLVLDESITSTHALLRACGDGLMDGVTLKIARLGGVTRTAAARDLAVELGLAVTIEDTGGASIDTAAMAHLSLSTPDPHRTHTVDFSRWVTVANADGLPAADGGELAAPCGPGLGVTAREADLGDPFHRTPA